MAIGSKGLIATLNFSRITLQDYPLAVSEVGFLFNEFEHLCVFSISHIYLTFILKFHCLIREDFEFLVKKFYLHLT